MNYEKLLLNEMRIFPLTVIKEDNLTDENMVKAMTVVENIRTALGIGLKPVDIIKLAKSEDVDTIYDRLKEAVGEVKAKPMYPDFPKTVMEMDEAQFRFHQIFHYFTTYGMELITGKEVLKGWLPSEAGIVSDTEKTVDDETLLPSKIIEFVVNDEQYTVPMKRILSKRNRATLPEKEILEHAVKQLSLDELIEVCKAEIPFKENLFIVFKYVSMKLNDKNQDDILKALHNLCQHTGDVFICIRYVLSRKQRLKTSQRRLFTKLLESYPTTDFKSNIILSNKKALNSKKVLHLISYNVYARSPEHMKVVEDFKNKKLRSWESQMKYLLSNDEEKALDFISQRPGMMLRMVAYLTRLGYKSEDILEKLLENAESLSIQTLVTNMNHFGNHRNINNNCDDQRKKEEFDTVYDICKKVLEKRLQSLDTPLKDKKVFIKEGQYSFADSTIEFNSASQEGGYIRSGLVFKIPEAANIIRFFVYWNDKHRVDIDLHSFAYNISNKEIHVGWNSYYNAQGICTSGDVTHSDAAEFIDLDMNNKELAYAMMNLHLYSGKPGFGNIDTCFAGLMAVKNFDEIVKLYNPKNCFITHDLKSQARAINYGFIDVQRRLLYVIAKEKSQDWYMTDVLDYINSFKEDRFTLQKYVDVLLQSQNCQIVDTEDEADTVLVLDKPSSEKEISLIDENFFADK